VKVLNSSHTSKSVRLGARPISIGIGITDQPDNADLESYVKKHPDLSIYAEIPEPEPKKELVPEPEKEKVTILPVEKTTARKSRKKGNKNK